jgi:hypothetical protein
MDALADVTRRRHDPRRQYAERQPERAGRDRGGEPHHGRAIHPVLGGLFSEPLDLREAPNNTLYVADYNAKTSGAIIAVNPSTGAQNLIASGGYIDGPFAIQYMKDHLFVGDSATVLHTTPNLVEITPSTGKQTLITQGGNLLEPIALQPGPGNTIYVADGLADTTGAIFQVDLHSGAQTLIADGGYLNGPVDMALDTSGNLIVVDAAGGGAPGLGAIVSIDPRTGAQTLIAAGGLLASLNGNTCWYPLPAEREVLASAFPYVSLGGSRKYATLATLVVTSTTNSRIASVVMAFLLWEKRVGQFE